MSTPTKNLKDRAILNLPTLALSPSVYEMDKIRLQRLDPTNLVDPNKREERKNSLNIEVQTKTSG